MSQNLYKFDESLKVELNHFYIIMNKLLKITYYLSILTILIWLLRPTLFWIIGLEFADNSLEFDYAYSWRYILPLAICLTITKKYFDGRRPKSLINPVLIRIGLSALAVVIVYMSLFTHMCGWSEKEVFYVSKHNSGKIALMEYGCGAYDSDSNPRQEIKIIRPMNSLFNWSHTCDTLTINQNEWTKFKSLQ